MPGPARAGALLYAADIERIASFYQQLLAMMRLAASAERIVLESPDFQLLVHALPPQVPAPSAGPRSSALRLFFTVDSLATARERAASLGGNIQRQEWQGPGFTVCNATDPEGNVFQVREFHS